jgi:hypothetical protein
MRCDNCLQDIEEGDAWVGRDEYEPSPDEDDDASPEDDYDYANHFCSRSCEARWLLDQLALDGADA